MKKTKESFNSVAAEQAERAKAYFTSYKFIESLEKAIVYQMVERDQSYCSVSTHDYSTGGFSRFPAEAKRDKAYLQEAFEKLKVKHPELNHIRLAGDSRVVLDTKPNRFIRRHCTATGHYYD